MTLHAITIFVACIKAQVNTVGHLTDYSNELIEVANKSSAHVFILTKP